MMMALRQEYWRWAEGSWADPDRHWKDARVVTLGIDVGSVSSEAVVCLDGELYAFNTVRTAAGSVESAENAMKGVFERTGLRFDDIHYVVGTGYGRVNLPFAHKAITEIACHGRGANYMGGPSVRTILDMGGQDCKAIRVDERGKVTNFLMNDKCAAGTGRGMEVIADLLEVPIEELGPRSFDIDEEPAAVSDVCVVFAKSEAMARLKDGWSKNKVIAAYCRAMAERVAALLQRVGVEPEFFITGGISKNIGVVRRIEEIIGVKALPTSYDTQIAGALGAALFAHALYLKAQGKPQAA
ncbi:benzoyl-CoA reductase, bzd-type, subunit Q [Deferrisoma camini]|uniref:benzoyl-CoA reductase, bzd-type, subunit Q n=1 Tax=Deferrisoma camini TaxID=1035120 RepID=UPI00046D0A63|nr:benzoyl-CoA reductase, bzd-type, subunit Q [Deferrisoma camini]